LFKRGQAQTFCIAIIGSVPHKDKVQFNCSSQSLGIIIIINSAFDNFVSKIYCYS